MLIARKRPVSRKQHQQLANSVTGKKVQGLRKLGEKLTKNQIKQIGDPALNRLKNLKVMKVDEVFAINSSLKKDETILHLIKQRDMYG